MKLVIFLDLNAYGVFRLLKESLSQKNLCKNLQFRKKSLCRTGQFIALSIYDMYKSRKLPEKGSQVLKVMNCGPPRLDSANDLHF